MTNNLKRQVKQMIRRNETIVNIINYLFTCDCNIIEIVDLLVNEFDFKPQLIKNVFREDFGMDGILV